MGNKANTSNLIPNNNDKKQQSEKSKDMIIIFKQ